MQKLHYHLNVFQDGRLDPLIFENNVYKMSILHLFSIKIANEPCLTLIINQNTIHLDIGI
jgi:hypothetical protein